MLAGSDQILALGTAVSHVAGATFSSHVVGLVVGHGGHVVHDTVKAHHSTTPALGAGAPTVSAGHMLLQLLLGMAVIVGVIVLGTKFARGRRHVLASGGGPGRRRGLVQVLGRQPLGKGVSVAVVQVGERAYLLGVTSSGVRRLGETDAQSLVTSTELNAGGNVVGNRTVTAVRDLVLARLGWRGAGTPLATAPGTGMTPIALTGSAREGSRSATGGRDHAASGRQAGSPGTSTVRLHGTGAFPLTEIGNVRHRGTGGTHPAATWTSVIEHLRERTVRRA
ncbi:MAG: flagellar biosynthetic protein FliO [Actinomycetota bacterium]|jgi:flagellar biogenesis protein FliO|nr:flagellar biosynthetic protein FliO [Actinomycetota bacterium]